MSHNIRVSSRAIIIRDDSILLNDFGNGRYYNFIGGGIEEGETAKRAVVREAMEEAGIEIDVGELIFSLEYEPKSCDWKYGEGHQISFFFRCSVTGETGTPTQPDYNPDDPSIRAVAKWVPLNQLNEISLLPAIQKELGAYLSNGVFSPPFWAEDEHL